ncbi:MAG: hypothetical protein EOL97_08545 [Spirochaetia bacterium]|nr:hypothetical protein [Spirochaetia bacterium]
MIYNEKINQTLVFGILQEDGYVLAEDGKIESVSVISYDDNGNPEIMIDSKEIDGQLKEIESTFLFGDNIELKINDNKTMRKFILKKCYPKSPKLGFEIEFKEGYNFINPARASTGLDYEIQLNLKDCVDFPEYWEEILELKEGDYITILRPFDTNSIKDVIKIIKVREDAIFSKAYRGKAWIHTIDCANREGGFRWEGNGYYLGVDFRLSTDKEIEKFQHTKNFMAFKDKIIIDVYNVTTSNIIKNYVFRDHGRITGVKNKHGEFYKIGYDVEIKNCPVNKGIITEFVPNFDYTAILVRPLNCSIDKIIMSPKQDIIDTIPCLSIKDINEIYVSSKKDYHSSKPNEYYEKLVSKVKSKLK